MPMLIRLLCLALGFAVILPAAAQTPKPYHQKEKDKITCKSCHLGSVRIEYEPVPTRQCLRCHDDRAALAKRTQKIRMVVKEKNAVTGHVEEVVKDINPHSGHHDKGRLDCYECHHEHRPSTNLCALCHEVQRWMKPTP